MKYIVVYTDWFGDKIKTEIEAKSVKDGISKLKKQGITPDSLYLKTNK